MEANMGPGKGLGGSRKQKKVVTVIGTVSRVLGKDYVRASLRRDSMKAKEFCKSAVPKEEAEQFLCSMFGDDCELSMAVVRDVFRECRYNVEKALEALLDLAASSYQQTRNGSCVGDTVKYKEDSSSCNEFCNSHSFESKQDDGTWSYNCRNYSQVLTGFEAPSPTNPRGNESDIPQKVLESLFNISRSYEHEPSRKNWRNVIKKMQSLRPSSVDTVPQQDTYAKGEEYHLFRKTATEHWDSMRSYYKKAAAAYSKGEREHATYLSDQGRIRSKLAREADEKASHDIFKARNKGIENVTTIDLHGQHVKQAMKLLKLHLLFGTYAHSIQTLRVITGSGNHGVGKSKLKQSAIKLVEDEGINWSEENCRTMLIKLDGYKEYKFLNLDSDND